MWLEIQKAQRILRKNVSLLILSPVILDPSVEASTVTSFLCNFSKIECLLEKIYSYIHIVHLILLSISMKTYTVLYFNLPTVKSDTLLLFIAT